MALGIRQGEALALRWSDIDLDAKAIRVRATRLRPVYEHGCGGVCGKKPGFCPRRRQRNPVTGETKSSAGNRVIGLPDQLVELLMLHREQPNRERRRAPQLWREQGRVGRARR